MSGNQHIETIKSIYEAFGRGDVDTIVGVVTDDVDWGTDTASTGAPWYGPRRGPKGVATFFADFGAAMDVDEFTPLTFAENGDDVLTVVRCHTRSRVSGKPVRMHPHHWFHFRDGKIDYYRGTEDTASVLAALAGA